MNHGYGCGKIKIIIFYCSLTMVLFMTFHVIYKLHHQRTKSVQICSYHQTAVNSTSPQVGCILGQIYRAQPLHHTVVGPLRDLSRTDVVLKSQRAQGLKL